MMFAVWTQQNLGGHQCCEHENSDYGMGDKFNYGLLPICSLSNMMKLCPEGTNVKRHSSQFCFSLAMPRPVVKSSPSEESFETHLPHFPTWKMNSVE
jgi:hypothetical protein